jgi:hypothetical protein
LQSFVAALFGDGALRKITTEMQRTQWHEDGHLDGEQEMNPLWDQSSLMR